MKVAIAAGGRFHALHLAHQLEKRNCLEKLYTFSYTKQDKDYVLPAHVDNTTLLGLFCYASQKMRLNQIVKQSSLNVLQDDLFDWMISKKLSSSTRLELS